MLRKLLGECGWRQNEDQIDKDRFSRRKTTRLPNTISETTLSIRSVKTDSFKETIAGTDNGAFQHSQAFIKRRTPVLFSTNRGLHLRVVKMSTPSPTFSDRSSESDDSPPQLATRAYEINFCDLERWSTNRAYTVSLEDTFTIARPPPVPEDSTSPRELRIPNRKLFLNQHCGGNSTIPVKRLVRFNAFSRFETRY